MKDEEPKYKYRDTVFFMRHNKIISGVIVGFFLDYDENFFVYYVFTNKKTTYSNVPEEDLFLKKEELVDSLLTTNI